VLANLWDSGDISTRACVWISNAPTLHGHSIYHPFDPGSSPSFLCRLASRPYLLMWIPYVLMRIFNLIHSLKNVTSHLFMMKCTTYSPCPRPVPIGTLLAFAVLCFFPAPVRAANAVCKVNWGWVRTFSLLEFCSGVVVA